jgi:uncharacterized protein with von Willebrand factor type A (vWA) domain
MFVPFIYELRSRGVPVGATEAVNLARALDAGLHDSSLDGFYNISRALLIHSERHLDDFDQAFSSHFRGIELSVKKLRDDLMEWLEEVRASDRQLTEEERKLIEGMDVDALQKLFEERLKEQDGRHDGGNKWVGTGGTSPFGHGGRAPKGIRVGGKGGGRGAMKTADARLYQGYRQDLTLDVRQFEVALRKLRAFIREGALDELDLDETIRATAKNAGEIEVVTRPPRKSNTRVILAMDVGGSMDPYARLCSQLFSAAKKSSHFKELRTYYFHNCTYGYLYETERFEKPIKIRDLMHECGRNYKLIILGDALMAPYELMAAGGSLDLGEDRGIPGLAWLVMMQQHFDRAVWLNPEPKQYWGGNTIEQVAKVFPMYGLTAEGVGEAVNELTRGKSRGAR